MMSTSLNKRNYLLTINGMVPAGAIPMIQYPLGSMYAL